MNTNMAGLDGFQKSLHPCALVSFKAQGCKDEDYLNRAILVFIR